ncbi:MAG: DUF934 domain-containing protein [Gammaproteobacteria bacterium]
MSLVIDRKIVTDPYQRIAATDAIPEHGAILLSLEAWQANAANLRGRADPVGVLLRSEEHPEAIAENVSELQLVALDFPTFRDGRAYSYARLLRERFGFTGELRAVGDVALEQLHYMERVGFDAFEIDSDNPLDAFATADRDFSVWYQPSADGRPSAAQLRSRVKPPAAV